MRLLPAIRLTGATILRDAELRQRSVAIQHGRISKGPLPGVDMQGYLILPGIVDLLFVPPKGGEAGSRLRRVMLTAALSGITTAWVTPHWSWDGSNIAPPAAEALLRLLRPHAAPDLRPALRVESHRTDTTDDVVQLAQRMRIELAWFESEFARLQDLQRHAPPAFAEAARRLGMATSALDQAMDQASLRRREVPRHLCRLAETFEEIGARYGSIGDAGGTMRETHSMIGARLAACPAAHSAAAAARAMGDPVLLSAASADMSRDLWRSGLGDALVSDGAPQMMVPLALSLAGSDLADLPRIWPRLSQRPAEIMGLADRGRLDHGCRADMVIVSRDSGKVEATICAGRLTHLSGQAASRFAQALSLGRDDLQVAAE